MIPRTNQPDDFLLDDLVDRICAALQAGEEVDVEQLAAETPHMAGQIRSLYETLKAVFHLDESLGVCQPAAPQVDTRQDQLLGDFRILRQIGRGGMGIVYEARQLSIDRLVALKILPFAALVDARALQRFRNEVTAIATLAHPHIVSVYSVGEERGVHYYAMQLVKGQSLATIVRELRSRATERGSLTGNVLSQVVSDMADATFEPPSTSHSGETRDYESRGEPRQEAIDTVAGVDSRTRSAAVTDRTYFQNVIRVTLQAAHALQHAHEQGIVHRDVKPGNLLLDAQGSLFVTDFGLARIESGAAVTMTGDVVGTLRYMSPEQILPNRLLVDHRTDVYSLGATLYELLTLQPMWSGHDKPEMIRRISFEEPPKPTRINPSIPADLETIVLKAISKNPAERYQTADEMADDLQAFLDHKPIVARRPTLWKHVSKWAYRQRRVLATAAAVALLCLSVGLVLTWNAWHREASERSRAQDNYRMALSTLDDLVNHAAEYERMIDLEDWRRQTLEKAVTYYTRFSDQHRGGAEDTELLLRVKDKLAKVHLLLQNYSAASDAAESGVAVAESIPSANASYETLKTSGKIWRRLGAARQRLGQTDSAAEAWKMADAIFARLLETESMDSGRCLIDVAEFLWFFAEYQHRYGDPRQAITLLERAGNLTELAAGNDPENRLATILLCEVKDDLGEYYDQGNNREASIASHREAVEAATMLGDSRKQLQLKAKCQSSLGKRYLKDRQTADQAEKLFREAITVYQQLVEDYPWDVYNRGDLAACQHNLALSLRDQGKTDEALEWLKLAQSHQSYAIRQKDSNLNFQLFWGKHTSVQAQIASGLKQIDQARQLYTESIDHLEKIIGRWPQHRDIRTYLISVYHDHAELLASLPESFGNPELLKEAEADTLRSLELLEALRAQYPEDRITNNPGPRLDFYSRKFLKSYTLLARVYSGWQRGEDALAAINQARRWMDRTPDTESPLARFRLGNSLIDIASLLSMNDQDPVKVEELTRDGLRRMQQACEDDPKIVSNPAGHRTKCQYASFNLAMSLYEQGKFADARREWDDAIAMDPQMPKRFSRLLHLYMEYLIYSTEESFRDYRRALELAEMIEKRVENDSELEHWVKRDAGVAHYRLGNFREAKDIFSDLMINGSFTTSFGYYFAMTLARLDPEDDDGPFFRKDAGIAFYLTEDKVRRLGTELDEELQALRQEAIEETGIDRSSDFRILVDQARACSEAGIDESAVVYWQQVVEQDPEFGEGWARLGNSLIKTGQAELAIAALQRAAEFPEYAGAACYDLGCVYALSNQVDAALQALNRAIELEFDAAELLQKDTDLDSLRDDERFRQLVSQVAGGGGD
jgi:serine/threonine protein kinase/Tfp pilus assembly protein PilF